MANGQNAAKNGHNREYWSRRPYSRIGWGKSIKVMTHRHERRVGKVRAINRQLSEYTQS